MIPFALPKPKDVQPAPAAQPGVFGKASATFGGQPPQQNIFDKASAFFGNQQQAAGAPPPAAGGQPPQAGPESPFTGQSNYRDLLNQLNSNGGAPGTDAFGKITGQYTSALGLTGGPGNGFNYGQLDPGRSKVYVPGGYDLKYENGQWVAHQEGPGPGESGGGGQGGFGGSFSSGGSGGQRFDELYNILMGRAQQGLNVNRTDPAVRGQADAFAANQDRSRRNYLGDQAEKMSPYATGAMRGQERMTAEHTGQAQGEFESQLMGREITAKRDEIQNALSQMGSMLSDQQRLELQGQLAQMNDAVARLGLGIQADDKASYWDAIRSGLL